jgi:hypothetical protein
VRLASPAFVRDDAGRWPGDRPMTERILILVSNPALRVFAALLLSLLVAACNNGNGGSNY